ncbi:heterokaryon incompatibility protein-domain-containing protein [Rhexocercosporidium sp. MPI-PUGE-AT-0058]|nr:heterokaryon incompatibility protein-domain-containing protein [Rhexocercosporidium sp. MPI-PUGE-AT-0058]
MRLINTTTLKLEEFFGSNIPEYAILSHTWEEEEVPFQEIELPSAITKKGYLKITRMCKVAWEQGYKYAWVDTCCIDKQSSAELTESINSMFQWYENARECFVFLSDLSWGWNVAERLKTCRWFSRGWTLQELTAPKYVLFFDSNWNYIGNKDQYATEISVITNIARDLLVGKTKLKDYSLATRMSWAAHRQVTRVEDKAYCLLGIFGVNMPMLYGEGLRAFGRLQEEIIKRSNDLTIFAWTQPKNQPQSELGALFAPSPAFFAHSGNINVIARRYMDLEFVLTNKGLRVDRCVHFYEIPCDRNENGSRVTGFVMPIGYSKTPGTSSEDHDLVFLNLWKVGPNTFLRESVSPRPDDCDFVPAPILSFYITADAYDLHNIKHTKMKYAVHFPYKETTLVQNAIPHSHWDHSKQLLFAPSESTDLVLAASVKICLKDNFEAHVVICLDFRQSKGEFMKPGEPLCLIFDEKAHSTVSHWLFRHKRLGYIGHDATWSDVREDMEVILGFSESVQLQVGGLSYSIQASLTTGVVQSIFDGPIYSLEVAVEERPPGTTRVPGQTKQL